jgi:methylated-DNA-[protein]-cysteine S-methyltransferase
MPKLSEKLHVFSYQTNIGKIGIAEVFNCITNLYFENDAIPENVQFCETAILTEAARQLDQYLLGKSKVFTLPLAPNGTDFMRKVWNALCGIPYGTTASYKNIAQSVGNVKAVRAVGMANNKNPLPIFIPCHRIIGSNGDLVGYRGGLELKKKLLQLELGCSNHTSVNFQIPA